MTGDRATATGSDRVGTVPGLGSVPGGEPVSLATNASIRRQSPEKKAGVLIPDRGLSCG